MGLTKQQRVFVAVLGVAGAALMVDQLILGGASSPSGALASPEALAEPATAPALEPAAVESPAAKALAAKRLAALDGVVEGSGADGFAAPAAWAPPAPVAAPVVTGAAPSENAQTVSLRLTAVITSGRPAARINDRLVLVGMKTADGVELIGVSERSATVRLPGGAEITLELALPGDPGQPR